MNFGEECYSIKNVKNLQVYNEQRRELSNSFLTRNKEKEDNKLTIEDLKKYEIYVWELKEHHDVDSTKLNVYNVHIFYKGIRVEIIEDVIIDGDYPRFLAHRDYEHFEYKKKIDDNTFEYIRHLKGKQKILNVSNNRYINDKILDMLKSQIVKTEDTE